MRSTEMPVFRPTADSIWRSFQNSGKKHIILTGTRGIGKTTMLSHLTRLITQTFGDNLPGITSWVVPGEGVYMKDSGTGETVQVGIASSNTMKPITEAFETKGVSFITSYTESSHADSGLFSSEWVSIDEIGFLENNALLYQKAILNLMERKHMIMVVRKQPLAFLEKLCSHQDVFLVDLDNPYGRSCCVIMASGQGKRFGGNKLLADFGGTPLINWTLDATEALFSCRVVVTIHKEIELLCQNRNIPVVLHNSPYRDDMIRRGLEFCTNYAPASSMDRFVFLPSDQPLIKAESISSLLMCAQNDKESIWRTSFKDTVGSPVAFPSVYQAELMSLPQGKGGNIVVKNHIDKVRTLSVSNINEIRDIDTREDLLELSEYL